MIAWSVGRNVGGTGSVEPIALPVLVIDEARTGHRRPSDTGRGLRVDGIMFALRFVGIRDRRS